jgi:hypothetical protein
MLACCIDRPCREYYAVMVLKVYTSIWLRKYKSQLVNSTFPGLDPSHVGGLFGPDAPMPFTFEAL